MVFWDWSSFGSFSTIPNLTHHGLFHGKRIQTWSGICIQFSWSLDSFTSWVKVRMKSGKVGNTATSHVAIFGEMTFLASMLKGRRQMLGNVSNEIETCNSTTWWHMDAIAYIYSIKFSRLFQPCWCTEHVDAVGEYGASCYTPCFIYWPHLALQSVLSQFGIFTMIDVSMGYPHPYPISTAFILGWDWPQWDFLPFRYDNDIENPQIGTFEESGVRNGHLTAAFFYKVVECALWEKMTFWPFYGLVR